MSIQVFDLPLQAAAAADANGTAADRTGRAGFCAIEVQKTGTGTCLLSIEGSFDGAVWYAAGYQLVDNTASPARTVTSISVGAGAFNHVYSVLDYYPQIRARISTTSGVISLAATLHAGA